MIRRAAQGEQVLNGEIECVLPARPQERRYWSVNYSPIFGEDGTVQAIAGATIEITQQKRAEQAILAERETRSCRQAGKLHCP